MTNEALNSVGGCCDTLTQSDHKQPIIVCYAVYDSRGNGEGGVAPTLTGDHQNRITDYTGIVIIDHSRRHNYQPLDIVPTLEAHMGTGGATCRSSCWAIDSHPMDSRMRIVDGACPSLTVKLAKLASDGPLVLIRNEL